MNQIASDENFILNCCKKKLNSRNINQNLLSFRWIYNKAWMPWKITIHLNDFWWTSKNKIEVDNFEKKYRVKKFLVLTHHFVSSITTTSFELLRPFWSVYLYTFHNFISKPNKFHPVVGKGVLFSSDCNFEIPVFNCSF